MRPLILFPLFLFYVWPLLQMSLNFPILFYTIKDKCRASFSSVCFSPRWEFQVTLSHNWSCVFGRRLYGSLRNLSLSSALASCSNCVCVAWHIRAGISLQLVCLESIQTNEVFALFLTLDRCQVPGEDGEDACLFIIPS